MSSRKAVALPTDPVAALELLAGSADPTLVEHAASYRPRFPGPSWPTAAPFVALGIVAAAPTSRGTSRRHGPTRCTGPSLSADDLEALVTDALLDVYTNTDLFAQAIDAHLTAHADTVTDLPEELTAAPAARAAQERVGRRGQDDYEAGHLTAARYEDRARQLDDELAALHARVADLEVAAQAPVVPRMPTASELQEMHAHLATGIRSGDVAVRKALFTALVERIEVHDRDDIRPVFRLYDPCSQDHPASRRGRAVRSGPREMSRVAGTVQRARWREELQ